LVWVLYAVRIALLSGERLAFNRLGANRPLWAAAWVAYAGGALTCLAAAAVTRQMPIDLRAVPGALVYSVSFLLYFWALKRGPLSVVGAWPAATALMLWGARPEGGWPAAGAVLLTVAGALILAGGSWSAQAGASIGVMLLSDAALAVGRDWDRTRAVGPVVPYAATVFLVVAIVMGVGAWAAGDLSAAKRLATERPVWTLISGLTNGGAYLTLAGLLRHWPPYVIEALSGAAGLATVAFGAVALREGSAWRKGAGALLLSAGAGILAVLQGSRP
jgi:hypothetical protein